MFAASHEDLSNMGDEEDFSTTGQSTHDLNSDSQVSSRDSRRSKLWSALSKAFYTTVYHFKRHAGAGVMASVAYFDPGNWSVDLQAGSDFGYKLLFVILLAGVTAIVLQVLACRLGCVTGLDLASHCRVLLHDHPRHPRLVRRLVLYPLYVLAETAIIATDLAELLGSAIALNLIFPSLPLWAGVILTSLDVLVILAISDDDKGRPARLFELIIVLLAIKVDPRWGEVFMGFLPSKTLIKPSALYTSIGILGATVMPHALFLGSSLATLNRVSVAPAVLPSGTIQTESYSRRVVKYVRSLFYLNGYSEQDAPDRTTRHEHRNNNSYEFVSAHLKHGMVDIIMSLSVFAIPINSASVLTAVLLRILVLAGAVFFFNSGDSETDLGDSAGLFSVHDLIRERLGKSAALLFAFALLAAGQSASITATLTGQIVSEGFIEWKVSPFIRRLVTRLLGLIPSTLVAALIGRNGIDQLLIASQVALSIVLPFVVFPLVYLTSSHVVMTVKVPLDPPSPPGSSTQIVKTPSVVPVKEVDYRNGKIMMTIGYLLFCLIVAANIYALVTL
ncbi:hypothetical protein Clacol_003689 [Clathrus columnatus]|uniref:Natural resistance-associated macrophage protein n=1 Tax=Clathrus columnatus TaxID=1419009 RepID=A0AAV5A478_9AGAM|nr:hypothetical protein Clacol_003689 [Clathrus columnatus]